MTIKKDLLVAWQKKDENEFIHLLTENLDYINTAVCVEGHYFSPLHMAAESGWVESCKFLLAQKAIVDLQYFEFIEEPKGCVSLSEGKLPEGSPAIYCKTALHLAAGNAHKDCVSLLLQHGANPNARDFWGQVPLWKALGNSENEIACVKCLLEDPRTDPNIAEDDYEYGDTPLHDAVRNNYTECVKLLIFADVELTIKNTKENYTAYELANGEMKSVIIQALKERNCQLKSVFIQALEEKNRELKEKRLEINDDPALRMSSRF